MKQSNYFVLGIVAFFCFTACNASSERVSLSQLLTNREKITPFEVISSYNGNIYLQAGWNGFPSENGWSEVPGFGGHAIIGNHIYYLTEYEGDVVSLRLLCSNLQGGNPTEIDPMVAENAIWVVEDKIIYAKGNWGLGDTPLCTGVYWLDIHTQKTTKLLDEFDDYEQFKLLSFDKDYLYYSKGYRTVWRVDWDGSKEETFEEIQFPDNIYWVEGDDYYCVSIDYESNVTTINRFSVVNGEDKGAYLVEACGLIAIKEGCAYYGNQKGIFSIVVNTNQTAKLSPIDPFLTSMVQTAGGTVGVFINNVLYFNANFHLPIEDEYLEALPLSRLYSVPLAGGTMEYMGLEWLTFRFF